MKSNTAILTLIIAFSFGKSQTIVERTSRNTTSQNETILAVTFNPEPSINPDCGNGLFFVCEDNSRDCIPFENDFCDTTSHCSDGSDEVLYNETIHTDEDGIRCRNLLSEAGKVQECLLPKRYVGDRIAQCELGEDECGYNHTFYCQDSPLGNEVQRQCIVRTFFCDGVSECFDMSDEKKHSKGAGFKCAVKKLAQNKVCDLPSYHVCDGFSDCEHATDECFCDPVNGSLIKNGFSNGHCFRCLDGLFAIDKRHLCDGIFHCDDLSDECICEKKVAVCNQICTGDIDCQTCSIGQIKCARGSENFNETCINTHQICDRVYDCPLGEDEQYCYANDSQIFTCHDRSMNIPKEFQCDNATDCPDGSDEVNCSSLFFECHLSSIFPSPSKVNAYEMFRPRYTVSCDGEPLCEDLEDECNKTLCGDVPEYCAFVQGNRGFICPDNSTQFQLIGAEVCDGFPNCIVNSPQSSADELYCPNRFYCEDRGKEKLPIHISESARCDNIRDCFDESDEMNCSPETHFYCESGQVKVVSKSKVCDGIQDCSGGEDECQRCSDSPFSSDVYLINSYALQTFIWIIGIVSVVGNVSVLVHNLSFFWAKRKGLSRISYNHRILVTNLATADLLLGIYLISLGIVNTQYKGIYCKKDIQWRASNQCIAMGTIAVISVECCIFLLVTMASMRLCLVTKSFQTIIKRRYILVGLIVSWILALIIGLVPLAPSQTDYFVSQVWYRNNPFLTLANRHHLENLSTYIWSLEDYTGHQLANLSAGNDRSLTWTNMINTIQILNDTYQPSLYFGYYSAHGVCLPRFFPDPNQDRSWRFSLAVIIINFCAFVYMLIAYVIIYRISTEQSKDAGRADADAATSNLQRKITRIIFTNFCCWIPICILAFISASGKTFSPEIYAVSAIVLLPINSAFNPLLYSDLPDFIWRTVFANTKFGRWVKQKQIIKASHRRSTLNTYSGSANKRRGRPPSLSQVTKTTSNEETRL